jgi:hypothetical protein
MGFSDQVKIFSNKALKNSDTVLRKVCLDLFRAVIQKTPVDTGRAKNNWFVGVNRRVIAESLGFDKTPVGQIGSKNLQSIVTEVKKAKFGDTVSLMNSLPYILVLEYGGFPLSPKGGRGKTIGGFSKQAPTGMVRITVEEYARIVQENIRLVVV